MLRRGACARDGEGHQPRRCRVSLEVASLAVPVPRAPFSHGFWAQIGESLTIEVACRVRATARKPVKKHRVLKNRLINASVSPPRGGEGIYSQAAACYLPELPRATPNLVPQTPFSLNLLGYDQIWEFHPLDLG